MNDMPPLEFADLGGARKETRGPGGSRIIENTPHLYRPVGDCLRRQRRRSVHRRDAAPLGGACPPCHHTSKRTWPNM